jgi:hypothetical protein
LIDLTAETAELMDPEDGETLTVRLENCPAEVLHELRRGFEAGLDVRAAVREVGGAAGGSTICAVRVLE